MKVCVGKLVMSEKPIFTFKVGVWEAAKWHIANTTLEQTLRDKAFAASGVSPTDTLHEVNLTFRGQPEYNYEVEIYRYTWEEAK